MIQISKATQRETNVSDDYICINRPLSTVFLIRPKCIRWLYLQRKFSFQAKLGSHASFRKNWTRGTFIEGSSFVGNPACLYHWKLRFNSCTDPIFKLELFVYIFNNIHTTMAKGNEEVKLTSDVHNRPPY